MKIKYQRLFPSILILMIAFIFTSCSGRSDKSIGKAEVSGPKNLIAGTWTYDEMTENNSYWAFGSGIGDVGTFTFYKDGTFTADALHADINDGTYEIVHDGEQINMNWNYHDKTHAQILFIDDNHLSIDAGENYDHVYVRINDNSLKGDVSGTDTLEDDYDEEDNYDTEDDYDTEDVYDYASGDELKDAIIGTWRWKEAILEAKDTGEIVDDTTIAESSRDSNQVTYNSDNTVHFYDNMSGDNLDYTLNYEINDGAIIAWGEMEEYDYDKDMVVPKLTTKEEILKNIEGKNSHAEIIDGDLYYIEDTEVEDFNGYTGTCIQKLIYERVD